MNLLQFHVKKLGYRLLFLLCTILYFSTYNLIVILEVALHVFYPKGISLLSDLIWSNRVKLLEPIYKKGLYNA